MEEISYSGDRPVRRRRLSRRAFIFIGVFLAIIILIGGLIFFVTRNSSSEEQKTIDLPQSSSEPTSTPTPTLTPEAEKTPTPTTATKKSELRVAVQNGSGESGVAAAASAVLKSAGYSVISTGNADNYDYTGVTIQIKSSEKSFLNGLEEDLSSDYT